MEFNDGKASDAFRTIREVSDHIGVPQHILRFWETRFPQLKPLQRGGNRRYYRPSDVAFAAALHTLLHGQGYTVKGVQKLVAEHGADGLVALAGGNTLAASPTTQAVSPQPAAGQSATLAAILPDLRAMRDRLAAALAA